MPRELDFTDGFESSTEPTRPGISATLADNQAAPADVTGLSFDTTLRHAWVLLSLYRKDSLQEKAAIGVLHVQYKSSAGTFSLFVESNFDGFLASGVVFSITAGGQVQYTSTDFTDTGYVSEMQFYVIQSFMGL